MERDRVYVLDILDAARLALSYIKDIAEAAFYKDTQCQDSVIRRLEMIGEAARRISEPTLIAHPEVPWQEMIGLRNILIHEYDDIDLSIVWHTVRNELPRLISTLETILEDRTSHSKGRH
jgi:uncharacterized protein with HEPN domain